MKRFLILLTVLMLLAPCAAAEDALAAFRSIRPMDEGETLIDQGESPDFVEKLLAVAAGELGYVEGGNNFSKYGEWSGDPNAAWCAEFICWCVNQVDEQENAGLLHNIYPKYSGQNTGRDWFIKRGRFVYRKGNCPDWGYQWLKGSDHYLAKNEYIPHPGDLMFFSYNEAGDTEHVALVEFCARNELGEVIIHVIEGNNPDRVQRNAYRLDDSQVLGFGTCEDRVDTTMRFGNEGDKVTALQKNLNRLGFLDERHITGIYGSNTRKAVTDFQLDCLPAKTATGIADRETQQAIDQQIARLVFESPETWLVEEEG